MSEFTVCVLMKRDGVVVREIRFETDNNWDARFRADELKELGHRVVIRREIGEIVTVEAA